MTHVTYDVEKGEILGLIGPNGAGKTTLFNVVNGFYPPTHGEVLFKGEKISHLKPHQICKLGIARTFQVVRPLQRMTTLDNVIASAFLRAKSKAEAKEMAIEMLRVYGSLRGPECHFQGTSLGEEKKAGNHKGSGHTTRNAPAR